MTQYVVIEVDRLEPFLSVYVRKVFLPRNLWSLTGVQVNPYKAVHIDVNMNWEEAILRPIETIQLLIARGFGKLTVQAVRPTMISATEDARLSTFFLYDGIRTVPAYVMKSSDISVAVQIDDDVETCKLVSKKIAGLLKPGFMGHEQPSAGEDCSTFKVIEVL